VSAAVSFAPALATVPPIDFGMVEGISDDFAGLFDLHDDEPPASGPRPIIERPFKERLFAPPAEPRNENERQRREADAARRPRPAPPLPRRREQSEVMTPKWLRRFMEGRPEYRPRERGTGGGSKGIPWTPVYDYGCGWRDCPLCGPKIALEIEAKHRKKVAETYPRYDERARVQEFLGDLYGTAEDRGPHLFTREERQAARGSQAKAKGTVRVKRSLKAEDRKRAEALLAVHKVKKKFLEMDAGDGVLGGHAVWLAEVWLELLNPSKLVANREKRVPIDRRVEKAVNRAESILRKRLQHDARFLPTIETLQMDEK